MFIGEIKSVQAEARTVRSLVKITRVQNKGKQVGRVLQYSFGKSLFKFLPIFAEPEPSGGPWSNSESTNQGAYPNVESAAHVMHGIAKDQRNIPREREDLLDLGKAAVDRIYVVLGNDFVKVAFKEADNLPIKILDVMIGPFELSSCPPKHGAYA
jgi:hypothetical protein